MAELIEAHYIQHSVTLMGFRATDDKVHFIEQDDPEYSASFRHVALGGVTIVHEPAPKLADLLSIRVSHHHKPSNLYYRSSSSDFTLKTLHTYSTFSSTESKPLIRDDCGRSAWVFRPYAQGGFLFIGSDLFSDLLRFRQGDSTKTRPSSSELQWGFTFERPNYLFTDQLRGEPKYARHADRWSKTLAEILSDLSGLKLANILPNNAPGAVVITGDDDQAYLESYAKQQALLAKLPITYLLHPQTRHTQHSLKILKRNNPNIDLGIHPDALDYPSNYPQILCRQVAWYRNLTGTDPLSLRNHGYLNDGYWNHLQPWLSQHIRISSNLPGLDGTSLNGSYLPALLLSDGKLTNHWSVLTAIGDGLRFSLGMTDTESAYSILQLAYQFTSENFPGLIVLNLHPQNVDETFHMHQAIHSLATSGFLIWNLRQCLAWFDSVQSCMFHHTTQPHSHYAFSR